MSIILSTHIEGTPVSLIGHQHYLDYLEIGLYQRIGPEVEALGFSFFSTSSNGGALWDGQQLRMLVPRRGDLPKVKVSLFWNKAKKQWKGHYERGDFSRQVTLKRPEGRTASPFVGTWFDSKDPMNNCIHIAQQSDGGFTAWADDIALSGRLRYANGIEPPPQSNEHYGEIAKARLTSPSLILVELRAYIGICCSHQFKAAISPDGSELVGDWPSGPNQAPRRVEWKSMPDNSCSAAASEH